MKSHLLAFLLGAVVYAVAYHWRVYLKQRAQAVASRIEQKIQGN